MERDVWGSGGHTGLQPTARGGESMRLKEGRLPVPHRRAPEVLLEGDNYPEGAEGELKNCEFRGVVWGSGVPDTIKLTF